MRLRKKIGSSRARLFALNFDARLPGIVIWSDRPYLDFFTRGHWNRKKTHKTHKIHAHKIQGVFFLRSAKRRRQRRHRHKGLGDPKIDEHSHKSFILVQKWQGVISTSIFWNLQICIRTYPMRGYLWTWYFINLSARGYLLTWYFINPIEREYLLIRLLRLTFWQRFYIRKNYLTNET